ncbi:unnamed protein product [Urochloa decumbens]|uniref:Uncharacterized protein n=1 Tax=Urochloa decumbens TaxID=240449 RepID=A0ABC9DP45_9POAL
MCLPFCCGNDDHGSPSQGGTGTTTATHDPHHGDGKTEPVVWPSTGNGKESNNGNGVSDYKNIENFKNGGSTDSPPPTLPPTPPPQSPEGWAEQVSSTSSWQASEHIDKHKNPSPTPATKDPKMSEESPEHSGQISTVPTPATKGPKQQEHLPAGPHPQGPVSAPAPQPKGKANDTIRTPPSPQIARRGGEGDYYSTAAPTVPVFEPAANNGLGDNFGHDDDGHAYGYGGKDDRRLPGKSRR